MTAMADRIEIISAERVRDELTRLLLSDRPRPGLDLLVSTGLADRVLPELPALRLERDEHHRHKDVYQHSLTVLEQAIALESRLPERAGEEVRVPARPDLINRLAALLHDIGKPATRRFEPGGKVSFHHHDVVGRQAGPQAADRAAVHHRGGAGGLAIWSRCTCGSTATATISARDGGVDRLGGPPLRPRRRRPAGPAAHPDPGRLHHPEPGAGGRAAVGVRRPGAADRRACRAGGAATRCGPDLDGNQIMACSASRRAGTSGRAYHYPAGAPDRGGPARRRTAPARSCSPGGPRSSPDAELVSVRQSRITTSLPGVRRVGERLGALVHAQTRGWPAANQAGDHQVADGQHDQDQHRLAVGRQDDRPDHRGQHQGDVEDHVVEHEDAALERRRRRGPGPGCRRRS